MLKRYYHIFLLALCALWAENSYGQFEILKNNQRYDQKPIHFGFSLGLNYYDLRTDYIPQLPQDAPEFYSMRTETNPGYTIRIISNLRLGKYFDLRFTPGFASTVRTMHFDVINPITNERDNIIREVESGFLEFPLSFKFKSQRVGNYRLYLLAGPQYSIDLRSDEDIIDDRVFKLRQNEFYYNLGVGVDIYFEYFKFSPQLVGSFGITNQKVEDGTVLVQGIQSIYSRAILINFTFE